jgi:hypothetical protein
MQARTIHHRHDIDTTTRAAAHTAARHGIYVLREAA